MKKSDLIRSTINYYENYISELKIKLQKYEEEEAFPSMMPQEPNQD